MYKNSFVVLIKKNGQSLRELHGRDVFIPFNSEYTIEIRNNNYRRAVAKITIDGTDVLGTRELIIPAFGSETIERFVVDGNLKKGKKLKFVPLSNEKVSDPTSPENGLIEVELWLEKSNAISIRNDGYWPPLQPIIPFVPFIPYEPHIQRPYWYVNTQGIGNSCSEDLGVASGGITYTNYNCNKTGGVSVMSMCTERSIMPDNAGATVEGGRSSQTFTTRYFGEKEYPSTRIKVWLKGLDIPITTADSLHCVECGKKLKNGYKFCPKCGNCVEIA